MMMKMSCKTLFRLTVLLLATRSTTMGQVPQKPVNVPSPTPFAFQQYGNLNTSHYTGALQLNIPLYELLYKDLRMPIVLNYNSTGLRADQVPGWTGVNFSMNIGGSVTRQIKGLPDEFDFFLTSECQFPNIFASIQYSNGYLVNSAGATFTPPYYAEVENDFAPFYNGNARVPHSPLPFKPYNVAACSYAPQTAGTVWPGDLTSFPGNTNIWDQSGKKDLYPDEFTFNCLDLNGSFMLQRGSGGSTIVITANRPVKVALFADRLKVPFAPLPQVAQGYDPQISYSNWSPWTKMGAYPKTISGFQVTDDRGIAYYFGKNAEMLDDPNIVDPANVYFNEIAIEYSIGSARLGYCPPGATDSKHLDYWKADAWHLVRILMPDGRKIDLNYERGDEITTFQRGLFKMVNPTQNFNSAKTESFEHKSPVYLSSVVSDLVNIELFRSNTPFTSVNYTTNNGYTEMNRYVKLDSMTIKGHAGPLRCFGFNYQYDPANRWFLKEVREKSANTADWPSVYQLEYENINALPPFYSGKTDHWGYFNNNYSDLVTADNLFAAKETNPLYVKTGALTKITYPTGGSSTFEYEPNTVGRIVKNKSYLGLDPVANYTVGGLRIKRIYNNDGIAAPRLYKQFYYTNNYAPNVTDAQLDAAPSSGILAYRPTYTWTTTVGNVRMVTAPGGYTSMNSLTNYPVKFLANQPLHTLLEESPVGYSTVVEKNAEGGYVVHQFTDHVSNPNLAPINEYNGFAEAPYAKASSKAFERGLPSAVSVYDNAGQMVSRELTSYAPNYLNADGSLPSFTETAAQALEVSDNLATIQFITGTTFKRFNYQAIESQKENITYDGGNTLSTKVQKYYDNPLHKQPTRVVTYASNGDILRQYMKYPQDYNTGNYLVQCMVARGYTAHVIETIGTVQKNGSSAELVTSASLNEYNLNPANTNDVLVHRVYSFAADQPVDYSNMAPTVIANMIDWDNGIWAKDGRYKVQMEVQAYGGNKTIASYTDKSGAYIGVLYDKANLKQTALIQSVNGPLATDGSARFAVANFETGQPNEGKWAYLDGPFDNTQAHTGQYSYKGDLLLKAPNTTALGFHSVWVEVWAKTGGNVPVVERRAALNTGSMVPVQPTVAGSENGWTLYRYYNNATPSQELYIRANGNSMDDIKVYPTNGSAVPGDAYLFTLYAYNPVGQLSFVADPNNRRVYHAYDRQGRLSTITDQDGKIVKKFCYRYNGQPEDCGLYYNVRIAQTFARNNCGAGTTGQTVLFVAPAAMFGSAVSQADADAQALAYLNANGQVYANANGNCTDNNVCNGCTGINKKCINGVCEQGIAVTTNCYYNTATGQYEHTYHYEFSDGSWSADVTEYSGSPICFTGP
jgi:YD repeat-containing protein